MKKTRSNEMLLLKQPLSYFFFFPPSPSAFRNFFHLQIRPAETKPIWAHSKNINSEFRISLDSLLRRGTRFPPRPHLILTGGVKKNTSEQTLLLLQHSEASHDAAVILLLPKLHTFARVCSGLGGVVGASPAAPKRWCRSLVTRDGTVLRGL